MNILLGICLIGIGSWLTIVQAKNLMDGKPNSLGGISGLLIAGLGVVACGIIEIIKAF